MRTKAFLLVLALVLLGSAGVGANSAGAQSATFPAGCGSGLGYSVSTGDPCNGTDSATIGYLPGCTSALGYSTINAVPCSGGSIAIQWLSGCSSSLGYSVANGMPCNGTATASLATSPVYYPPAPGFPITGLGGNALANILFLGSSALIAALGLRFILSKKSA